MEKILDKDWRLFLLLFGWSVVVLMLMSPDSPLHGTWNRVDSAWFFMGGKALMNGMRPYVDFTDSKGLLLWLFYGVGYLLSPKSYFGVYVVSCLLFAGIFYYNYKTAQILLRDSGRSLMVILLMVFPYFIYWFHFEVRAEDLATFFVSISLYYLFLLLYGEPLSPKEIRKHAFIHGACFTAIVFIKYSIAVMHGSIILAFFWFLFVERKLYFDPMKWLLAGMVAVALPFLAYLGIRGCIPAFFKEYFYNTFLTVSVVESENIPKDFWGDILSSVTTPVKQIVVIATAYGGWLLSRQLSRYRYVPLLIGLFFYIVATRHNLSHYYNSCNLFYIYLFIGSMCLVKVPVKRHVLAVTAMAVLGWGVFENLHQYSSIGDVGIWNHNEYREADEYLKNCFAGSNKPKVLNLFCYERGFGLSVEALPAGKQWSYQVGMTEEMKREHLAILESRLADYVVVYDEMKASVNNFPPGKIRSYGYERVGQIRHKDFWNVDRTSGIFRKIPIE